jgi:histidine triad (HIT) family protein
MESDCIFCSIIARTVPANIVAENDDVLVIKDHSPKARIHYLIMPKTHYKDLQATQKCDVACSMMSMARKIASEDPVAAEYRLMLNNGYNAGQRVFHLHMHFLAGSALPDF